MSPDSLITILKWLNPKPNPKRGPRYLRMVLFWNPVVSVIFTLGFSTSSHLWMTLFLSLVISTTICNVIYALVAILIWVEGRYFKAKGLPVPQTKKSRIWTVCILGMLPGLYVGFLLAGIVADAFHLPWDAPGFADYRTGMMWGLLLFSISILADLWNSAMTSKQAAELQIKQLENERLQAQISALTAQMNPHLMFNALNTIASMIQTDPKAAEDVTVRLSELYRGVLDSSRKSMHSVDDELKICRAYLDIERSRFGDRLQAEIKVEPSADLMTTDLMSMLIPTLLLQPLVENAIKHGLAPRASGGKVLILIKAGDGKAVVTIEDDGLGIGNSPASKGAGSGLTNCRSRMQLMYGDLGACEIRPRINGGTVVELMLPLSPAMRGGAVS